jgi:putative ABC transport system permease protein
VWSTDPSILDQEIIVNGAAHRVIGVMPAGFFPTRNDASRNERDPQVFLPLHWTPATKYSRTEWGNRVYARVKPGLTLQQVQAEMDLVASQIHATHPEDSWQAMVVPLADYLFGQHEQVFVLLLAAVGLVLFIACANVANLLLASALERRSEFAVRAALGASRAAILRQVLMESMVIAGVGGLAGVALSPVLIGPTLTLLPAASTLPRLDQVRLDSGVLLFTLILSTGCGLVFGMVPAIRAGRGSLALALSARGRGTSTGKREGYLSDGLVIVELALSLVLLVGGGLLTRVFLKLLHIDPDGTLRLMIFANSADISAMMATLPDKPYVPSVELPSKFP